MKISALICLALGLGACTINENGLNPTALQEYIAMTDAQATVQAMDAKKPSVAVTPHLSVKPKETQNNLYANDGAIVFQGLPAAETQLLLVNPNGSVTRVNSFEGNPYGTYIAFTPQAIYNINRATGQTVKFPRVDTVTIASGAAPILPGQPFP